MLKIRRLEERDIDAILTIQTASPEIAQWTAHDYGRAAHGEMAGWIAEDETSVLGFLVARLLVNEIEILNFAVHPTARRRQAGTLLLQQALAWGTTVNAVQAILEVRASNVAALRFYEKHNFRVTGRRPRYYQAPVEDALLLNAPLS